MVLLLKTIINGGYLLVEFDSAHIFSREHTIKIFHLVGFVDSFGVDPVSLSLWILLFVNLMYM